MSDRIVIVGAGQAGFQTAASLRQDGHSGEIVLLGRLHGVPTPVNEGLQRLARHLVTTHAAPGVMTDDELAATVLTTT